MILGVLTIIFSDNATRRTLFREPLIMILCLKEGKKKEIIRDDIQLLIENIIGMIRNIEERGDTAFAEYSEKFDKWTSKSSKLSKEKIQACYERV